MIEHWTWYLPEDLSVDADVPRIRVGRPRAPAFLVDLGNPLAFGAVLRWWSMTTETLPDPAVVRRWLLGETTDVDRLLVARACGELMAQLRAA